MALTESRAFGEVPSYVNTGSGSVDFSTVTGGGYCTIQILSDTIFSNIVFAFPSALAGNGSLNGVTIPAGNWLYGVKTFTVASGNSIAYLSQDPAVANPQ
jgi:hypothetical protein